MNCKNPIILKAEIDIPQYISDIIMTLINNGHKAYIVGGAVRDSLIGRVPIDWDISSSAPPEAIRKIFGDAVIPSGERFGTLTVLSKKQPAEITTFRKEIGYSDGRRPDKVIFSNNLKDDLARRDFTINALAYDILQKVVIDYFGGIGDLENMVIRAVGNPEARFNEDSLRMPRAIRLAAELNFNISRDTLEGIKNNCFTISRISPERIRDELSKMLLSPRPGRALEYTYDTHLLDYILPELSDCAKTPAYHGSPFTVLKHSIEACENIEPKLGLRLAALLHDIGKPLTMISDNTGRLRFPNHEDVGADLARIALKRLKYPKDLTYKVTTLIKWHMFRYQSSASDKGIRRLIRSLGIDNIYDLAKLRKADRIALGLDPDTDNNMTAFLKRVRIVLEQGPIFTVKNLAINGYDVMELLGIPEGPEVGRILNKLLDIVLEKPDMNSREILLDVIRPMTNQNC